MSLVRTRHADILQQIMTSFSQFEKKLDKLQDDVNSHGQTLTDLRTLVNNISTNTISLPNGRNELKHSAKKTFANQYDTSYLDETQKPKRKNAAQSLPSKMRSKNFQGQKTNNSGNIRAYPLSPRTMTVKRSPRARKAEAPRKATTLRPQKGLDKKRSKKVLV